MNHNETDKSDNCEFRSFIRMRSIQIKCYLNSARNNNNIPKTNQTSEATIMNNQLLKKLTDVGPN